MRAGWQRRIRLSPSVFAAVQAMPPASCVLGKRGAGPSQAKWDCTGGAALHFRAQLKPQMNADERRSGRWVRQAGGLPHGCGFLSLECGVQRA
jgi:hypothetical protein